MKINYDKKRMDGKKITIGLLLDTDELPAWLYESIHKITALDYVDIAVLIYNDSEGTQLHEAVGNQHQSGKRFNPFFCFLKMIDAFVCSKRKNKDAFQKKNIRPELSQIPSINVRPRKVERTESLLTDDVEQIKAYNLDILVKIGFGNLRGDILTAAKYGVWAHYAADPQRVRGGPVGFWEVMEQQPVTGAIMEILSETPGAGRVLCRSWSTTYPYSFRSNCNYYHWTSSDFLPLLLTRLHSLGEARFFQEVDKQNSNNGHYFFHGYSDPGLLKSILLSIKYVYRLVRKKVHEKLYWDQWYLLYNLDPNSESDLGKYKKIPLPDDEFWADPHILKRGETYYIFLEIFTQRKKKGHLSVMEMDSRGNLSQPVTILEKDYHLSYPFVLEWDDKVYMIPETKSNKTIELYECTEFPYKWEFKMNLMENVKAVDTTLLYHNGKWWMFTLMLKTVGARTSEYLHIFYADNFVTNEWTPHILNPVKIDARSARPGGAFFEQNGKIYRPAQDCSYSYGYGMKFHELVRLTETEFEEKPAWSLEPRWEKGVSGVHSYAKAGQLTVIDALKGLRRTKRSVPHQRQVPESI